ncbi:MAG: GYD domain-containing protein [Pseudorhodoplanes sp.]
MPIFITQGRYTREAVKGMIDKPEDRAEALSRLMTKAGARLIGYYVTFGEYDFMTIVEAQSQTQVAAALFAAASRGGVTDLRTTVAMTSVEAKGVYAAAGDFAASLRTPGGV